MIEHSESIKELATALAAAQGEMENAHKSSDNPFFRSKYADLAEIINTVRPVLSKHGLAVVQVPGMVDGDATVETLLTHASGEWVRGESRSPMPISYAKDGKEMPPSPQNVGSATTYLRRYSLAAFCGIAQEDDDGEAVAETARNGGGRAKPRPQAGGAATDKQAGLVKKLMKSSALTDDERAGIQRRIDHGMTKAQASEAIDWIQAKIDAAKAQPEDGYPTDDGEEPPSLEELAAATERRPEDVS